MDPVGGFPAALKNQPGRSVDARLVRRATRLTPEATGKQFLAVRREGDRGVRRGQLIHER
jgi:hypothetical protein